MQRGSQPRGSWIPSTSPLLWATKQARVGLRLTTAPLVWSRSRAGSQRELRVSKQQVGVFCFLLQIFSIVVFGSIVNECYVNKDSQNPELLCIFNENESACGYGIAVGIIAFFGCIFFLVVDLYFQQISSVKDRKRAVLLDLGFSGTLWALPCRARGCPGSVGLPPCPQLQRRSCSLLTPCELGAGEQECCMGCALRLRAQRQQ